MALEEGPPGAGLHCWGSVYWELAGNDLGYDSGTREWRVKPW
jgi:hypothetical protein